MAIEYVSGRAHLTTLLPKDREALTLWHTTGGESYRIEAFDQVTEEDGTTYYRVPRYFKDYLSSLEDRTTEGEDIEIELKPEFQPLNEYQEAAINAIVDNDHGLVAARVGFGKTYVAINAITKIKKRTLIVAHISTEDGLLDQWKSSFMKYTNLTEDDIGYLNSSTKTIDKPIYLTTVQTLISKVRRKDSVFDKLLREGNFGVTFYDECHISASSGEFARSTALIYSKRIYGLSATLERNDGLKELLYWNMGRVIYSDNIWFVVPLKVALLDIPMYLGGYAKYLSYGTPSAFSAKYAGFLIKKPEYITEIARMIDCALEAGRNPLVLSSQIKILSMIRDASKYPDEISIVHGKVKQKDYTKRCILATLGMFKVGMDIPRLDTLIFATPLTAKNGLIQAIGRIARTVKDNPNKYAAVLDITNSSYGTTSDMRKIRLKYYSELNRHSLNGCLLYTDFGRDYTNMFKYLESQNTGELNKL